MSSIYVALSFEGAGEVRSQPARNRFECGAKQGQSVVGLT